MPETLERTGFLVAVVIVIACVLGVLIEGFASAGEAASSGESGESAQGNAEPGDSAENTTSAPVAPEDLTFLCNPLNLSREAVSLSQEDREQVEDAASVFVATAYGDPGPNGDAYKESVGSLVAEDCFYSSPASGHINDRTEVARQGGAVNAPSGDLDSPAFAQELMVFDIGETEEHTDYGSEADEEDRQRYLKVTGTAVWSAVQSNGKQQGKQQAMTLVKEIGDDGGGSWRVSRGEVVPPKVKSEYRRYFS